MENNTILLTKSGDLEVYEGKRPRGDSAELDDGFAYRIERWLSTKKIVKMAKEELYKMIDYLNIWNKNVSYPIDVSDIVTLKPTHKTPTDHFLGHLGEMELQCYFTPQPVDKEEETQEKSVRELAKESFDKYCPEYKTHAFAWHIWKKAFDIANITLKRR